MKIYIACDHNGIEVKKALIKYLDDNGIIIEDINVPNHELDDYPDYAFKLCNKVLEKDGSLGILICGNGIGMCIAANKVKGIRCVRAINEDDAFKGKHHNGSNVIALGANLDIHEIIKIVDTFINTKSVTIDRHIKRVNKIINYENGEYNEL